jgi:hypothetical protein
VSTTEEVRQNYLKWALDAVTERIEEYEMYQDYYNGDHELAFSTQNWTDTFGTEFEEFADNWCQIVVDSMVQRLEILGFESDSKDDAKQVEKIFERNYGILEADDIHTQAAVKGDAFITVWEDPENQGEAQFFFNDATEVTVFYDPENPRRIARAAKRFVDLEAQPHMYVYLPDRTDFWFTPREQTADQAAAMISGQIDERDAWQMGYVRERDSVPNPWGQVPVFHFKNRGRGLSYGQSELKVVIPVQNAVNKLLMDMMVGSEFGSFRQKWAASNAQPRDGWRVGGDRVWATSDTQAKFGEFGQIDLEPIFKAVETMVAHIAKITQTPMHYLRSSGDMPSGEALKTAESGLVQKVEDRQKHWGSVWGRVMEFALRVEGKDGDIDEIKPKWKGAATRHELEQAQTAQLKSIMGVPLKQIWSEHFGYTEDQIADFEKENKAVAAAVLARVMTQISQAPPGAEQVTATPEQLIALLRNDPSQFGNAGEGQGLDVSQILAMLPKGVTGGTTAGEATTKPQVNTRPPASPTRRSSGFKE